MDKRELIEFILNDIKELELIVKGMHEMDKIPGVMQELAIGKTRNILDRFRRLEESFPKEEISLDNLLTKESFIFDEEPELLQKEEISLEKEEEYLLKEEISEKFELQEENIVELVEKEQKIDTFQEVEPEEKKTVSEPVPVRTGKKVGKVQPADQQPEEKKSTVVASEKVKVQVQERITNERFKFRDTSVNNTVVSTNKRIENRFIQNLRKAINLNDRYRYQKELFGGNLELMNSVVDKLDAMASLEDATDYLRREFAWDAESKTVTDFYLLLESRFS